MVCESPAQHRAKSSTTLNHASRAQNRLLTHLEEFREYRSETEAVLNKIFEMHEQASKEAKQLAHSVDVRFESYLGRCEDLDRKQAVVNMSLEALQTALHSILQSSNNLQKSIPDLRADMRLLQKETKASQEQSMSQLKTFQELVRRGDKAVAKDILSKMAEMNEKIGVNMQTLESQIRSDLEQIECNYRTIDARVDVNSLDVHQIHERCAELENEQKQARAKIAASLKSLGTLMRKQLGTVQAGVESRMSTSQSQIFEATEKMNWLEGQYTEHTKTVGSRLDLLANQQQELGEAQQLFESSIKQRTAMMVQSTQLDLEEALHNAADVAKCATGFVAAEVAELRGRLDGICVKYDERCRLLEHELEHRLASLASVEEMKPQNDELLTALKRDVECKSDVLQRKNEILERKTELLEQQFSEDVVSLQGKMQEMFAEMKIFQDREVDLEARCGKLHVCIVEQTALIEDAQRAASRIVADKMAEYRSELRGQLFDREQQEKQSLTDLRRELQNQMNAVLLCAPSRKIARSFESAQPVIESDLAVIPTDEPRPNNTTMVDVNGMAENEVQTKPDAKSNAVQTRSANEMQVGNENSDSKGSPHALQTTIDISAAGVTQ
eukprot:gnl/MRDRNA2_/MRDRNA2_92427_c0_seq1.p1 gnl/MRDRNA2_/MRDRNA2_92427_c0~~gnl/MRDRNA2_/MRDRNA2_92427_c0_seq1.p1  ORF type:complete len:613 (+),score=149.91 gnl/MRDRNA2_/MRDRNA2_92427_c0_seq1:116-1954(+)